MSDTIGALREKAMKSVKKPKLDENPLPPPKTIKVETKFKWDPEAYRKGQQKKK